MCNQCGCEKTNTKVTLEYDFTDTLIKCDSCGKEYKLGPFKPFA